MKRRSAMNPFQARWLHAQAPVFVAFVSFAVTFAGSTFAAPPLARQANDLCTGAELLVDGAPVSLDTRNATVDLTPPWGCGLGGGPDLWYEIRPTNVGVWIRVETCGSLFDSVLELFEGDCGNLVAVACEDNQCFFSERIDYVATSTAPLYARIGGWGNSTGLGTIVYHETVPRDVQIVNDRPGAFIDISATGTPLSLEDDTVVTIQTTIGNELLPSGGVRIASNGGLGYSTHGHNLAKDNEPIPSTSAFQGMRCILPFWDDIDTEGGVEGQIYWEERSDRLIVQWDSVEFYPGGSLGSDVATFQVQVFDDGPVAAQFVYQDIEHWTAGGGLSATIGFQSGDTSRFTHAMHSFDTAGSVSNGDVLSVVVSAGGLGVPYCATSVNSTGTTGELYAVGSAELSMNDLRLRAARLPAESFAVFLAASERGFIAGPAGSAGNLCLGGNIGLFHGPGQVKWTGVTGEISLVVDTNAVPQSGGAAAISPGETWRFQAWHRDASGTGPTSNFTNGLEIAFQ